MDSVTCFLKTLVKMSMKVKFILIIMDVSVCGIKSMAFELQLPVLPIELSLIRCCDQLLYLLVVYV